ncbi:MAG: HD domain-containing protein [Deltaproteobacteria bacterium]|nr:HD domain-containing protein [Deltaproteobacteria bacterium]
MLSEKEKLDKLTYLGIELNQVRDLDILMERVLECARSFVNADAGSIYIRNKDEDTLQFTYTQNDTLQERLPKDEKLIYATFTLPINKESISGHVATTGRLLNIPNVYEIEPTASYHFGKQFDEESGYQTKSVITVPLKTRRGDILGILQIINAQDENKKIVPFTDSDEKLMLHFASTAAVALERAQMTRSILLRMIRMSEMRDPKETGAHVNRVGGYSIEIYEQWAKKHNLSREEFDRNRDSLRMAAMLHDVGKIAISDIILKKPSRFNKDEFETMKQHTFLGARLFLNSQSDFDEAAFEVALNHHERWDGRGYPGYIDVETVETLAGFTTPEGKPLGKKGDKIPIFGRIVALADVYDALSSKRVYKEAWEESDVLATIEKESGAQFDPELIEIFYSRLNILRSIQNRYTDAS